MRFRHYCIARTLRSTSAMYFFTFAPTTRRYRSFVISAVTLLFGRFIDCSINKLSPVSAKILGIYEKLPAVCDRRYREKYFPKHQNPRNEIDYDAEFLSVNNIPKEFAKYDRDESSEFMINSRAGSRPLEGNDFGPRRWNCNRTSEANDLEDNGDRQGFLPDCRGEEIKMTKGKKIHQSRRTVGEAPRSSRKKSASFLRYPKINVEEEISAKPYTMVDTFGSMSDDGRVSSQHFLADLRRAGWTENHCRSLRRIVGGSAVSSPEKLPYIVFVDTGCGGGIIGRTWVLTAGHCIEKEAPRYIHTGSVTLMRGCQYNVVYMYIHPRYNKDDLTNDVALLKISPPFVYSPAIRPIRMSNTRVRRQTCGIVAGWGATIYNGRASRKLNMAIIPVVSRTRCRMFDIKPGQFCAGYRDARADACQGDSGGPFVINGLLAGIVSYGYKCARPNTPGVYVDVSYHRQWIRSITRL